MSRRSWALLLAVSSVPAVSGCVSSSGDSLWSRSMAAMPWASREDKISADETPTSEAQLSPEFKAAQKTFKNTEQTMLVWARYQEDVGEFADARRKYRELLVVYPDCVEASIGLARIELQTGRSQQAEEILTELEQRVPGDRQVKLAVGRMYSRLERYPEAVAAFERAVEIDASSQESRYELGIALARMHQLDPALAHLTYAVGEPAANYNIGYILHEQGRDADAVEWFRNALAGHPDEQTSAKSRTMLAQLDPAGNSGFSTSDVASNRSRHATAVMPVADYGDESTDEDSRPGSVIDRIVPAQPDHASGRRVAASEFHGTTRPSQRPDEVHLPPVESDDAAAGRSTLNSVQTVSRSRPLPNTESASGTSAVQNWNGPRAATSTSRGSATHANQTIDPPPWRSRR